MKDTKYSSVCRVLLPYTKEYDFCVAEEPVDVGEWVVAETRYGKDIVQVTDIRDQESRKKERKKPLMLIRKADEKDLQKRDGFETQEQSVFKQCQELVQKHKLDMKLIRAYHLLEEPKWVFFFSAENRVDFRALVRDLVARFHQRIELRQVGVRDEARMVGGVAICSRELCCRYINEELKPVTIKMAKSQDISFKSVKVSGLCGRLLCCLGHEYTAYQTEWENLPRLKNSVELEGKRYTVTDVNVLTRRLQLKGEEGELVVHTFREGRFDEKKKAWVEQGKESSAKKKDSHKRAKAAGENE